jgi:N-acetylglucosamine-6-phosphate deacetylase
MTVLVEDGVAKLPDRSALAGSVATGDRLVRTAASVPSIGLSDALRMASATPASIMGMGARKGMLEPGYDADLVLFGEGVDVKLTMVGGRIVHRAM